MGSLIQPRIEGGEKRIMFLMPMRRTSSSKESEVFTWIEWYRYTTHMIHGIHMLMFETLYRILEQLLVLRLCQRIIFALNV